MTGPKRLASQTQAGYPTAADNCIGVSVTNTHPHRFVYRLAALSVVLGLVLAASVAEAHPPKKKQKPTVAIMYFDYEGPSPSLTQFRKGMAQMLISDLAGQAGFDVVERGKLEALLKELKLSRSRKIDRSSALRMGRLLAARFMVFGRIMDNAGQLILTTKVIDVETGSSVSGVKVVAKADDFMTAYNTLMTGLEAILQKQLPPRAKVVRRPRKRPRHPKKLSAKTVGDYGAALDALDKGDKAKAKKALEAVVKKNPKFTLANNDLKKLFR
jgi:TolB-like protein